MGEFRIGRRYAQHSYPDAPRVPTLAPLARNFATGPKVGTAVAAAGTQVPWNSIDFGPDGVDVQITPQTTGLVRVSAVIAVGNSDVAQRNVQVQVQIGNVTVPLPVSDQVTVAANGLEAIPFLIELSLPVGVPSQIQILVTAEVDGQISLSQESSSMELQEVSIATG